MNLRSTGSVAYQLHAIRKHQSASFTLEIDRLEILAGETLCLVGPTGAGKSTLLRLLSGLEPPTAGQIALQGRAIEAGNVPLAWLRQVATVSQRPMLLAETVRYNVEYGLRVRGVATAKTQAEQMLERLGLQDFAKQDARTLSGGQVQLVALARALVLDPAILLLDEPTAHLDPAHVALVENLLQEQKHRTAMTLVWATHHLFQARRMATRVGLLLGGRLIEVAEPQTFWDAPRDERTAAFVHGKMVY